MDSLTHIAFGAALGETLVGNKIGRRAMLWGAALATLPDLDILIPHDSYIARVSLHRSWSHSLLVMALVAPAIAWMLKRIPHWREVSFTRATLCVYALLATHALLDSFTVYGTQLLWPIPMEPISWSSVFIIDPLFSLPLFAAVFCTLIFRQANHRFHIAGLTIACAYLLWSLCVKIWIDSKVETALDKQHLAAKKYSTSPTAFNTLLWRALVLDADGGDYREAYLSIFDGDTPLHFSVYPRNIQLLQHLNDSWAVKRLRWFTHGYYAVRRSDDDVVVEDLRMGMAGTYFFRYAVGELKDGKAQPIVDRRVSGERGTDMLPIIWARIFDPKVQLTPSAAP